MKLIAIFLVITFLTGCSVDGKRAAAKKIVANREQYKVEILAATNECIKNANTLTSLAAAGNDSAETIEECSIQAQKAYGAYNPWYEDFLLEQAYGVPNE